MRSSAFLATLGMALYLGCTGTTITGTGGGPTSAVLCHPGDQKACACGGAAQGVQACLPSGIGYGTCHDCTVGSSSSSSSGTSTIATGCTSDSECAAGETCAAGVCAFSGCLTDADCLAGETCDTATGVCTGTPVTEPSCQQCACQDVLAMGGCANLCKMGLNGTTTPNFCDGVSALPQCAQCLSDNCGSITNPPDPNSPAACM
jgi:Cys-rich repeat protein